MQMCRYNMDSTFSVDYMPVGYASTNFIYNSYPDAMTCTDSSYSPGSILPISSIVIPGNQNLQKQLCANQYLANKLESAYIRHSGADERFLNTKTKYSTHSFLTLTITLGIIQTILISRFL